MYIPKTMTNPTFISDLYHLHNLFGVPCLNSPQIPKRNRIDLRDQLVNSEVEEFNTTLSFIRNLNPETSKFEDIDRHLGNLADDLCDILYVVFGTALEFGIPLHIFWPLVQEANLNKLWDKEVAERVLNTTLSNCEKRSLAHNYLVPLLSNHDSDNLVNHGWTYKETSIKNKVAVFDESGKFRKPPGWLEPDMKGMMTFINMSCRTPNHSFRFIKPNHWFYITLEDTLEPASVIITPNEPSVKSFKVVKDPHGNPIKHYKWNGPFHFFFDAQNHALGNPAFTPDLVINPAISHHIPSITPIGYIATMKPLDVFL